MSQLLFPKEVVIKTLAGDERIYILSKFPAIAGREIVTQYPVSAVPRIGDYKTNEALMLKIMGFVAVPTEIAEIRLSTSALVDNHVPDYETLMKIEFHMMDYNTSFFSSGKVLTFFGNAEDKASQWITKTLTALLEQSFPTAKPRSKNSEASTH